MKIAMVSEHASPLAALGGVDAGGQNVHVAALAAALARRGDRVTVFTRRDAPDLPDRVETDAGVVVEHVPAGPPAALPKDDLLPYIPDFGRYLASRWTDDAADLVHAHFWMSGLAAMLAARGSRLPVVQTFHALGHVKRRHQGAQDSSPPQRLRIERALARDVARIIATCTDEVDELVRLDVRRCRVSVVPCGVDTELFRPDGPVAERGPWRHRLVTVGRLVERKGIDDVIRALRVVRDTELVVIGGPALDRLGSDPEAARLRAVAEQEGVADRVRITGGVARGAMPALLRSADLVVSVPWYEPFGIVPLEAMACGVPVVASGVGGLLDTVVDGATGTFVPPRRPDLLAECLRRMLVDTVRRQAYGVAGVDRVRARYTWDSIGADTAAVYADVLGAEDVRTQPAAVGQASA
jgi:D-inositol-3-phosphate glycosyltransferase